MKGETKMAKRPPDSELLFAEENPSWLNEPSPFEQLDKDWIEIIIFYVFHVPVANISARGYSLETFGWGKESGKNDYKKLISSLIKNAGMEKDNFQSCEKWEEVKPALEKIKLLNFPEYTETQRIVFRKTHSGICDSLLSHIRNSFAHGRLSFYEKNNNTYIVLEDIDNKKTVTARMILSKQTLLKWKTIIKNGPQVENNKLFPA